MLLQLQLRQSYLWYCQGHIGHGAGVTISESGIEASGIGITCANINGTQIGGRRNIIINGDMKCANEHFIYNIWVWKLLIDLV